MAFHFIMDETKSITKKTKPLRIVICCCSNLFGEGIRLLIQKDNLIKHTVVNLTNPDEIVKENPDLIISDYDTLTRVLSDVDFKRNVRILLLGTNCHQIIENESLADFISKGLVGLLPPTSSTLQFNKAIKSVISGEFWLDRKQLKGVVCSMNVHSVENKPLLNARESGIIRLICRGYSNKEIVARLSISDLSVRSHLNRIYKKIGVSDRLQLAIYAIKRTSGISL